MKENKGITAQEWEEWKAGPITDKFFQVFEIAKGNKEDELKVLVENIVNQPTIDNMVMTERRRYGVAQELDWIKSTIGLTETDVNSQLGLKGEEDGETEA